MLNNISIKRMYKLLGALLSSKVGINRVCVASGLGSQGVRNNIPRLIEKGLVSRNAYNKRAYTYQLTGLGFEVYNMLKFVVGELK